MKREIQRFRTDAHLDMQLRELSALWKVSKSVVIRTLILNSIRQIQDERGNWILPRKIHEQKEDEKADYPRDDADPFRQME